MRSLIYSRKNPYDLILLLCMFGSLVIFLIISTLYLFRVTAGEGLHFRLPFIFWLSTILMMASSFSIREANRAFRSEQFDQYKNWLGFTLILGIIFAVCQFIGWLFLQQNGILLSNNPAGAFIYLLSGLHLAHIGMGLGALGYIFYDALKNANYVDGFIQSLNPVKQARLKLLTRYWHFVDVLWLYLFMLFVIG